MGLPVARLAKWAVIVAGLGGEHEHAFEVVWAHPATSREARRCSDTRCGLTQFQEHGGGWVETPDGVAPWVADAHKKKG